MRTEYVIPGVGVVVAPNHAVRDHPEIVERWRRDMAEDIVAVCLNDSRLDDGGFAWDFRPADPNRVAVIRLPNGATPEERAAAVERWREGEDG